MSQEKVRVFVEVNGGVIQNIDAPSFCDVEIIDWDNFKESPETYWTGLTGDAQTFLILNYPDDVKELIGIDYTVKP